MPEPYAILHGGFHKTASTFLQKTLKRNEGFLDKRGVHYVHHRHMRKQFTVPCQLNAYHSIGVRRKTVIKDDALRDLTEDFFAKLVKSPPHRLVLTDENLAGHCGHCIKTGDLYQYRDPFMKVFSREIPFEIKEVHLAIRNYADFFAAAYVEYVRSLQTNSVRFVRQEDMCEQVFRRLPAWNGVINTAAAHFPKARIHVWRFEDFIADPGMGPRILGNLVGDGVDVSRLKEARGDSRRPSASARAMAEIQMLIERDGIAAAAEQANAIQKKFPRNAKNGTFDPWSAWERAHLTRLYDRDFARLRTNDSVTILTPENVLA